LMKFVVGDKPPHDPSLNPVNGTPLRPFNAITQAQLNAVKVFRELVFERRHGSWVINGELAGDLTTPIALPKVEQPEIWTLTNKSGGWWHPIHIHSEFHRVIRRDRGQPAVLERDGIARKDTVVLGPNSQVDVYQNFRDYAAPFMVHCHNLA